MFCAETLEKIQKICKVPAIYRNNFQMAFLQSCTKEIKLFKDLATKYGESAHLSCCQHILYEFTPKDDYAFKYGDVGTKFYILLKGAVTIYIPAAESGRIVYKEIMTFSPGSSFGELALEGSKTRSASALCKTDSHFLILLQKDYLKFMQRIVSDKKNEMINFIHSLPAFQKLNKLAISKMVYNIKEVSFTKGQVIFNENDPAKEIFIIKDGECKLSKIISTPSSSSGIRKIVYKRVFTAKRVGKGSMVAEDDIMSRQSHSYSCICSSEIVNLYVIPAEDFFFRVTAEQPLKYMKKISKEKKNFLDGWSSCRSTLNTMFGSKTEVKIPLKKRNFSNIDNIQKLKNAMVEKKKEESCESSLKATPISGPRIGHKKYSSMNNLLILASSNNR